MTMKPFLAYIMPVAGGGIDDAHPEHPIVYPPPGQSPPPHIWGGGNVPMPTPPIANVPGAPGFDPGRPPTIWGPPDPRPTPPIHIPPEAPPDQPPPTGPLGKLEWKTVWTEEYGWAVVGLQTDPHVAPSKS